MTDKPKRIQRKRTKGWKMPPNTIYVGRPTIYGNPWRMEEGFSPKLPPDEARKIRLESVQNFRDWINDYDVHCPIWPAIIRERLRGKNLACWCRLDQLCHADVLLEIANSEELR